MTRARKSPSKVLWRGYANLDKAGNCVMPRQLPPWLFYSRVGARAQSDPDDTVILVELRQVRWRDVPFEPNP